MKKMRLCLGRRERDFVSYCTTKKQVIDSIYDNLTSAERNSEEVWKIKYDIITNETYFMIGDKKLFTLEGEFRLLPQEDNK